MFCISYSLLKRTFTIICDNDLIPLLFPLKTADFRQRESISDKELASGVHIYIPDPDDSQNLT